MGQEEKLAGEMRFLSRSEAGRAVSHIENGNQEEPSDEQDFQKCFQ